MSVRCKALAAISLFSLLTTVQSHCTVESIGDLHMPHSFIIKTLGPYYIAGEHSQGSYYVPDHCNVSGNQDTYHSATRFKSCDSSGRAPRVEALSPRFGRVLRAGNAAGNVAGPAAGNATVYIDVICAPYMPNRYRRNIRTNYLFGYGDGRLFAQFV